MSVTFTPVRKLGSGGFGEVWLSQRSNDGKQFAIKYLTDKDPDSVARFQREVRCLSKLDHPNIVKVVSHSLAQSPYWYAMVPYSHSLYKELGPLIGVSQRIYPIFRSILDAVRYAHSQGVIHRDLKPENVLMNSESDLVVSDFGLGRIVDSKSTRLTVSGTRIGTPLYCAPEQMLDTKAVDHRADIFSLGRMLYELYSGELTSAIQDLSSVPDSIASIVERSTGTKPDRRYPTVEKMIEDFDSTMQLILGISESGSLEELLEKLKIAPVWTEDDVARLAASLDAAKGEDDIVLEALMKIPPPLFSRIVDRSKNLGRVLSQAFSRHARSQSWPFTYTDSVADVAEALASVVRDGQMRADFFEAALIVAYYHNRWHAYSVAGRILQSAQEIDDVVAFAKVLRDYPSEAEALRGYVDRIKIHLQLRPLLSKTE